MPAFTPDDLPVLYLDEALVAVAKPSGLAVHKGWARDPAFAMTLVRDRLGRHVYPVHRLDRATSGVLLFALSPEVAGLVAAEFAARRVDKRYLAAVRGCPPEAACVDRGLRRDPRDTGSPRLPARTCLRRLAARDRQALVEAAPRTGRLHQVRRHLKHLGHPLLGDVRYGDGRVNRHHRAASGLHRLALHAWRLALAHPVTGAPLAIVAPLPADLAGPLEAMGLPAALPAGDDGAWIEALEAAAPPLAAAEDEAPEGSDGPPADDRDDDPPAAPSRRS